MWIGLFLVLFQVTATLVMSGFIIHSAWRNLAKPFPTMSMIKPNYRRNFQSFQFGQFNLGWCVHVVNDDDHLHLLPVALLRWLQCQPMSIPWKAISLASKQPFLKRYTSVKIGLKKVTGPAWCFALCKRSDESLILG